MAKIITAASIIEMINIYSDYEYSTRVNSILENPFLGGHSATSEEISIIEKIEAELEDCEIVYTKDSPDSLIVSTILSSFVKHSTGGNNTPSGFGNPMGITLSQQGFGGFGLHSHITSQHSFEIAKKYGCLILLDQIILLI